MFEVLALILTLAIIAAVYRATRSGPPADAPGDEAPRPDDFDKP